MLKTGLLIALIATPTVACAKTSPAAAPKQYVYYAQPAPHVLDVKQANAFAAFADLLWGDKALLSEVCVARGKEGYVARAAGVVSADKAAIGEVKDGKVMLYNKEKAAK